MDLLAAPLDELMAEARAARGGARGMLVTYSPKVFLPLTKLCRDVCHYCTFARPPRRGERAYLTLDELLDVAPAGAAAARPPRAGWPLPGGARHAGGQARAPLPRSARRARRARLHVDARIPPSGRGRRARRDRPAPALESGGADGCRRDRTAAGERLDGRDAGDDVGAAVGARRAALRLARQAAGCAHRDDRG